MSDNLLLKFENITKKYPSGDKELTILENLNFSLVQGSSVAIVGKSGSGKTTFLNLAGALDKPTSGKRYFNNISIDSLNDKELSNFRNKHIGFVFQNQLFLDDFTALENVVISALIGKRDKKQSYKNAKELLERVGLKERMYHRSNRLSGGEKQRVAICRALINQPDLLIADEPTGSLDESTAIEIENLLFELVNEKKQTLLMVTHNLNLAKRCSKLFLLQNGVLEEQN
ncbi:MAG: ABC transporter ATP-binding protein [Sphaerochaetaceae bacterium]|jgi:ABC-type lipoprotein export system ATPase subunit